jgi:hypothetical protein
MPCDTKLKPKQTIQQRAQEIRDAVARVTKLMAQGKVRPVVGANGAIAFAGLTETDRDGVTDACLYRRIMATGSPLAKAEIARAEARAGRTVNRAALAQGIHSHDGGNTWHNGH